MEGFYVQPNLSFKNSQLWAKNGRLKNTLTTDDDRLFEPGMNIIQYMHTCFKKAKFSR